MAISPGPTSIRGEPAAASALLTSQSQPSNHQYLHSRSRRFGASYISPSSNYLQNLHTKLRCFRLLAAEAGPAAADR